MSVKDSIKNSVNTVASAGKNFGSWLWNSGKSYIDNTTGLAGVEASNQANQVAQESNQIAQQNLDFSKESFEYQKQLNSLNMAREDSAIQRSVNDSYAAGISPLANMAGSSSNSIGLDTSSINSAYDSLVSSKNNQANIIANKRLAQFKSVTDLLTIGAALQGAINQNQLVKEQAHQKALENRYLDDKLKSEAESASYDAKDKARIDAAAEKYGVPGSVVSDSKFIIGDKLLTSMGIDGIASDVLNGKQSVGDALGLTDSGPTSAGGVTDFFKKQEYKTPNNQSQQSNNKYNLSTSQIENLRSIYMRKHPKQKTIPLMSELIKWLEDLPSRQRSFILQQSKHSHMEGALY